MDSDLVSAAAILVMLPCLWTILKLGVSVPGGRVGRQWRMLSVLVLLFAIAHFAAPLFGQLPAKVDALIVGAIFILGTTFVLVSIRLFYRIFGGLAR